LPFIYYLSIFTIYLLSNLLYLLCHLFILYELSLCSKEKEEKWKSPKNEILKRVLLLYKAEKEHGKAYRCDLPSDDETIYSSGKEINTSQLII
jgi:hypothetical protein